MTLYFIANGSRVQKLLRSCAGHGTRSRTLPRYRVSYIHGPFHCCHCVAPKCPHGFPKPLYWEALSLGAWGSRQGLVSAAGILRLQGAAQGWGLSGDRRRRAAQAAVAAAEGVWWIRRVLHCICDRAPGGVRPVLGPTCYYSYTPAFPDLSLPLPPAPCLLLGPRELQEGLLELVLLSLAMWVNPFSYCHCGASLQDPCLCILGWLFFRALVCLPCPHSSLLNF